MGEENWTSVEKRGEGAVGGGEGVEEEGRGWRRRRRSENTIAMYRQSNVTFELDYVKK